jgi:hypothetical protein
VPRLILVLVLSPLVIASCGGASSESGRSGALHLGKARAFSDYELYYLGKSFHGLPLTSVDAGEDFGYTDWSFIYGDCIPSGGDEPSCAPPLEVQNWSICARFPARYTAHKGQAPKTSPTTGMARSLRAGGGQDIYTGHTTVVIFGGPKRQAPKNLRSVHGGLSHSLPAPVPGSLSGELPCQAKFVD